MMFRRFKQKEVIRQRDAEGKANFTNLSYFGILVFIEDRQKTTKKESKLVTSRKLFLVEVFFKYGRYQLQLIYITISQS